MSKKVTFNDETIVRTFSSNQNNIEFDNNTNDESEVDEGEVNEDQEIRDLGLKKLDIDSIAGQEEETQKKDGDTIITPFNLKDEANDGYFDKSGNFIFSKKTQEDYDPWLDSIDWGKVDEESNDKNIKVEKDINKVENDKNSINVIEKRRIFDRIAQILKSNETVLSALKRLAPPPRQMKYKTGKSRLENESHIPSTENSTDFKELTELADTLMGYGDSEIYWKTSSAIKEDLKNIKEEAILDDNASIVPEDIIYWYYKWNLESTEVFGPFDSSQMHKWKTDGLLNNIAYCKRKDSIDDVFIPSDTINFNSYI